MLLWILIIIGVITLDQLSKLLAVAFLKGEGSFVVINKVLRFTYVENRGAAFGMLDDQRWIFLLLSTIGIAAMIVFLFKFAKGENLLSCALSFVIGGGIGNMIDRTFTGEKLFEGFVVDFIDFYAFPGIWMWVFNVADAFVCIGAGMMMLYLVLDLIKEVKNKKQAELEELEELEGESDDV